MKRCEGYNFLGDRENFCVRVTHGKICNFLFVLGCKHFLSQSLKRSNICGQNFSDKYFDLGGLTGLRTDPPFRRNPLRESKKIPRKEIDVSNPQEALIGLTHHVKLELPEAQ